MNAGVEIYPIDSIGRGTLAIMAQPASQGELQPAIAAIAARGIHQVVSLLESAEVRLLGLEHEAELVNAASMQFLSFPITDMGLPGSSEAFAGLAWQLYQQIEAGSNVVIHCRGGIGRSGLLAAAVLLHAGFEVPQAFAEVARKRGRQVPETVEQGNWLAENQAAIVAVSRGDAE